MPTCSFYFSSSVKYSMLQKSICPCLTFYTCHSTLWKFDWHQSIMHHMWCCGKVWLQLIWLALISLVYLLILHLTQKCYRCCNYHSLETEELWKMCGCSLVPEYSDFTVRNILNEHNPGHWIGHGSPCPGSLSLPPFSPDLTTDTTPCRILSRDKWLWPTTARMTCVKLKNGCCNPNISAYIALDILMHQVVFQTWRHKQKSIWCTVNLVAWCVEGYDFSAILHNTVKTYSMSFELIFGLIACIISITLN